MILKQKIYNHCVQSVNEKIQSLKNTLSELRESASNETKSTAGDKHETALAMLQIEQENTNRQLAEALSQKDILQKIDAAATAAVVSIGSLVATSRGYLFVSIALGKITINGITTTALSPQSPLGAKLKGLKAGDKAVVSGTEYMIESIA
jgi:transcription elongation GreA/GreB family factor